MLVFMAYIDNMLLLLCGGWLMRVACKRNNPFGDWIYHLWDDSCWVDLWVL